MWKDLEKLEVTDEIVPVCKTKVAPTRFAIRRGGSSAGDERLYACLQPVSHTVVPLSLSG